MRVRYSFSSRRTRRIDNIRKQREKFPKLLLKVIDISDIILQILDARFIKDTRNEAIEEIIEKNGKKIIYVLNKSDLIDKKKVLESPEIKDVKPYVLISATKRRGGKELRDKIKYEAKKVKKSEENKFDRVQIGVIGYPNTGKSSIINLLIGKTSAKTGSEAGFTKGLQKLKLTKDLLLIDSPGVIPNKEYSEKETNKLSKHVKVGARDWHKINDPEMVIVDLYKDYKKNFDKTYGETKSAEELIENVGKTKGALKKGGIIDPDKASRLILKDWQEGKIKL